jgi:hypothetical protein
MNLTQRRGERREERIVEGRRNGGLLSSSAGGNIELAMNKIPRIKTVEAIGCSELRVRFQNDEERVYDCRPILSRPEFHLLRDPAFFQAVRVDAGGYGVSWNDDLDLSEYELWTNGR